MIPVLLLYFLVLSVAKKRQAPAHVIASFVFCLYLLGVLTMTGVWWIKPFSPKLVYTPFADMIRGPVHTALNALLFVPLGLFLPLLYKGYGRVGRIALAGFLISLSVELVQMFGCGTTDINDLMTNTAGACLGYCVYRLIYGVMPKSWRKALWVDGAQGRFELPFFWIASLLVMVTIQLDIFHTLFR